MLGQRRPFASLELPRMHSFMPPGYDAHSLRVQVHVAGMLIASGGIE
jgi:hypothetical protein